MPPAGLEPATHGLRVHCSTNWAKGAHWHKVVSMGKETYYMFCASRITCYELTPHLVMLAGRRTKKCILQTYSLWLPLALFQATNSIRRLNYVIGKKFLAIRKLYNLQLPLVLFQATNSIRRLNISWARILANSQTNILINVAFHVNSFDLETNMKQSTNCND